MADLNKYKSVSVLKDTHEILDWLRKGNIVHADLSFSKTIEYLAKSKMIEILAFRARTLRTAHLCSWGGSTCMCSSVGVCHYSSSL